MISDTLFQAIEDIEEYQRRGFYAGCQHRIEPVKRAMRELQRDLDVFPSDVVTVAEDVIGITPTSLLVRRRSGGGDETQVLLPLEIRDLEKLRKAIGFVLDNRTGFKPFPEDNGCVTT